MISVLMPTFNRPQWVIDAARSVLSQDVDLELLILDNGSTDGSTPGLLQELANLDDRVRTFRVEENGSVNAWAFMGSRIDPRARFVSLMPDDDLMTEGALNAKLGAFRGHSGVGLVFSPILHMDQDGSNVRKSYHGAVSGKHLFRRAAPFPLLFVNNVIPMSTVVFRSKFVHLLESVALDPVGTLFDWHLWLSIAWRAETAYVPNTTVIQRIHDGQVSVASGVKARMFLDDYLAVWRHWLVKGHRPNWTQWEAMASTYRHLAAENDPVHEQTALDNFRMLEDLYRWK